MLFEHLLINSRQRYASAKTEFQIIYRHLHHLQQGIIIMIRGKPCHQWNMLEVLAYGGASHKPGVKWEWSWMLFIIFSSILDSSFFSRTIPSLHWLLTVCSSGLRHGFTRGTCVSSPTQCRPVVQRHLPPFKLSFLMELNSFNKPLYLTDEDNDILNSSQAAITTPWLYYWTCSAHGSHLDRW